MRLAMFVFILLISNQIFAKTGLDAECLRVAEGAVIGGGGSDMGLVFSRGSLTADVRGFAYQKSREVGDAISVETQFLNTTVSFNGNRIASIEQTPKNEIGPNEAKRFAFNQSCSLDRITEANKVLYDRGLCNRLAQDMKDERIAFSDIKKCDIALLKINTSIRIRADEIKSESGGANLTVAGDLRGRTGSNAIYSDYERFAVLNDCAEQYAFEKAKRRSEEIVSDDYRAEWFNNSLGASPSASATNRPATR